MREYRSQEELYRSLIPAINVKLAKMKENHYNDVKREDIWNCLKENKWNKSVNLTLGEMVNDIIHVDDLLVFNYIKSKKDSNMEGNV